MTQERRNNMKAPDKIYLQRVPSNQEVIDGWTVEPVKHTVLEDIEYIRKDALLEWAEEKLENMKKLSPSDGARIYSNAINDLVDKLNQM